ncbi:hypothetical protein BD289DRAFT_364206, partial [Coniella lustricola]
ILNSKIYTFAVGPNKKTFSIHGEALAGLSKPLDTLLNGPHQEAQELHVNWPEVDEEIFVRFIEWAYAKTYVTEDPTIFLDHSDIPSFDGVVKVQSTTPVAFYGQVCGVCGSALSDCPYCSLVMREAGPSPRARLIARFLDSNGDHYPASVPAFVPRQNTESCEDYSGVFMCHAKLYVVGDIYDIPELCQLSLHRLHATLSCFELFPGRCDDIAVVAKYLLANTREDDKIREMMALFYACQAEHVCNNDTFRSLLAEEPDFAAQVFSYVVGRL